MDLRKLKIKPNWSKTKEQIWEERFAYLADEHIAPAAASMKVPFLRKPIYRYAAAAVIAVVLLFSSMAFLYEKEIVAFKGEHTTCLLPDGSAVQLNADSRLSYKPYWWKMTREVRLNGEGYFEVTHGSTFRVHTPTSTVTVLGTSFNVYAREDNYLNVTCLTGKIQVKQDGQTVLLMPNMQAQFKENALTSQRVDNGSQAIGWTRNRFVFLATPLKTVIEEIERQYNIEVVTTSKLDYLYTGNFSKVKSPEEVLEIVGRPFGIEFKVKKVE